MRLACEPSVSFSSLKALPWSLTSCVSAVIAVQAGNFVGYDLSRRIRDLPGGDKIFLIALTGYGREQDRKAALEAGFDRHLVKPITLQQIEELLAATSAPNEHASITGDGGPGY